MPPSSKRARAKAERPPSKSGIARGYWLIVALIVGALTASAMRLAFDHRLDDAKVAIADGDYWTVLDEVTSGRMSRLRTKWQGHAGRFEEEMERLAVLAQQGEFPPSREPESEEAKGTEPNEPKPEKRVPIDPHLTDPDMQLNAFFEALRERENGTRKKVRMLYYGTSEIGHDRVTSQIRRRLQQRFGDGGKGWVPIDRTWTILDHRDVLWTDDGDHWTSYSIRTGTRPDGYYGLGGVLHKSSGSGFAMYETVGEAYDLQADYYEFPAGRAWSHIELHYQTQPGAGTLYVAIDGERNADLKTDGPKADAVHAVDLEDGPHKLRIEAAGNPTYAYGVVLERDEGFVLDALMIIGAWGHSIASYDPDHLKGQIGMREPALIAFQFGGKESLRNPELSEQQVSEFLEGYDQSVKMAMSGAPEATCLIVSPKDQGHKVGGRIQTRPAIPKLVEAAQEVAARRGCAFYNLFEAMGGEGTSRRWYHHTPRLVSGDYGHLEPAGSRKVGTLLAEMVFGEYEDYLVWRGEDEEPEPVPVGELVTMELPSVEMQQLFSIVREDSDLREMKTCAAAGRAAIDCRDPMSYIRTNERGQPLWGPHIRGLGGGYVGLGSDQSYNFIVHARSQWAWIFDYDPTVVAVHEIIRAVATKRKSPQLFVRAFAPQKQEATEKLIEEALVARSEEYRKQVLDVFRDVRDELYTHYRRSRNERPLFPDWGWLEEQEHYAYVRTMFEQRRIQIIPANLLGEDGLASVAEAAKAMEVPIRVVYLSNADGQWDGLPATYRKNMRALPFDEQTVVLRTALGARLNGRPGFSKWHYLMHDGLAFQENLGTEGPVNLLQERLTLSDFLSWVGPPTRGELMAQSAMKLPESGAR